MDKIFLKKIWMPNDRVVSGHLAFRDKPVLILDSGKILSSDSNHISYQMEQEIVIDSSGFSKEKELDLPIRISYVPRLSAIRKFSRGAKEKSQDIYPSSSNGFYGRLIRGKMNARYFVQDIVDNDKLWLTITDLDSENILVSHPIHRYEFDSIRMKTFFDYFP